MDNSEKNIQLVRDYLEIATPGQVKVERLGDFLAQDVIIEDSLMPIDGLDAFVAAMAQAPSGGGMQATVQDVVGGGTGSPVAARVLFEMGEMTVQFSQWFWIDEGTIQRIQVVYDPRPFLAAAG